jgi:hypothetical protein
MLRSASDCSHSISISAPFSSGDGCGVASESKSCDGDLLSSGDAETRGTGVSNQAISRHSMLLRDLGLAERYSIESVGAVELRSGWAFATGADASARPIVWLDGRTTSCGEPDFGRDTLRSPGLDGGV